MDITLKSHDIKCQYQFQDIALSSEDGNTILMSIYGSQCQERGASRHDIMIEYGFRFSWFAFKNQNVVF